MELIRFLLTNGLLKIKAEKYILKGLTHPSHNFLFINFLFIMEN